jgi:hypothetical protein
VQVRTEALVKSEAAKKERRELQEQDQGMGRLKAPGSASKRSRSSSAGGTGFSEVFVFDTIRHGGLEGAQAGASEQVPAELKGGLLLATYDEPAPVSDDDPATFSCPLPLNGGPIVEPSLIVALQPPQQQPPPPQQQQHR